MNAQELFLDVSSGRFLDGESTIPTTKPSFFSDEQRSIKLNVLKVKQNKISAVTPSPNARYKVRLGTQSLKLADASDTPTAPVVLFTAQATAVTAPASRAVASGVPFIYSPVTAQLEAIVSTQSPVTALFTTQFRVQAGVTALFASRINLVTQVTAVATATVITVVTQFVETTAVSVTTAQFVYINTITVPARLEQAPNIFSVLSKPSIGANNQVNQNDFANYPFVHGTPLYLTAVLNSPQAPSLLATISNGSVTTFSILARGSGYPDGVYSLAITGGGATAGTVTATAQAVALNGIIDQINILDSGSGYGSAPSVSLFTPDKTVIDVSPNIPTQRVNGRNTFSWCLGRNIGDSAPIRFTSPDTTSTTTFTSVPSAFLRFAGDNSWEINFVSGGYGYTQAPSVTHDSAIVSSVKMISERDNTRGGFKTTIITSGIAFIENGGLPILPKALYNVAESFYGRGGRATRTTVATAVLVGLPPSQLGASGFSGFPSQSSFAGRDYLAVVAGSTSRCATIRASVPRTTTSYSVFTNTITEQGLVSLQNARFEAEGGGFFETVFEVLDFGSDYQFYAKLPAKSVFRLQSGQVLLESPVAASVTIPLTPNKLGTGFVPSIISSSPTVSTRPGTEGVEHFIIDGGFGFTSDVQSFATSAVTRTVVTSTVTTGGFITTLSAGFVNTAKLTSGPQGYLIGTYDCVVQPPTTGNTALIQLRVSAATSSLVILDGGSGYTSAPVITAPPPNQLPGNVTIINSGNSPSGYTAGVTYNLLLTPSPKAGGTAVAGFSIQESLVTFASAIGTTSDEEAVIFNGVSTDVLGQLGARRVEEPAIPAFAKLTQATLASIVARSKDGRQTISQFKQSYILTELISQGFGYTTPPAVIAPSPSRNLGVAGIRLVNKPVGYVYNKTYPCTATTSPDAQKTAQLEFVLNQAELTEIFRENKEPFRVLPNINGQPIDPLKNFEYNQEVTFEKFDPPRFGSGIRVTRFEYITFPLFNPGEGYITPPVFTALSPDSERFGTIEGIKLLNTPVGYRANNVYELQFADSPVSGGNATAQLSVSSLGVISVNVTDSGFGYTTKPTITAPAPDLPQGIIRSLTVITSGRGYAPGLYLANTTDAPSGGQTAFVEFNVSDSGVGSFSVVNGGYGYVTAPVISVATPAGNIIRSLTITCQGSFYEPQTAILEVKDSSGSGAIFGSPLILSGKVSNLQVINGGYGYSDNPKIEFSAPTEPVVSDVLASQIQGDLNITTASANAILSTSTQKDILLEVYETDGTNEQVVAQATVSLAKRVLE